MTKAVKLTMFAVGIVAFLIVAAVVVFAVTFDVNDYKGQIVDAVRDETGRTLTFTGDMSMTYFPTLGVRLDGLELSNAPGFGEEPMARVAKAHIAVRIMPLFSGQILFRRIYLDGLVLNLSRNANGDANWDDLSGGPRAEAMSGDYASKPVYLEAAGVTVRNASLLWKDEQSGRTVTLGGINADLGDIRGNEPFAFKGNMDFQFDHPGVSGTVKAEGTLSLDMGGSKLSATSLSALVEATGEDVPGGKGEAQISADSADYAWSADTIAARGMTLSAYGATLHFDGTLDGVTDFKQLAGNLAVDPLDGRKLLADMGESVPAMADDKALTSLALSSKVAYTPRSLALKDLELAVDGSSVKGDFKVSRIETGVSWYARIDADTLDMDRYLPPRPQAGKGAAKAETPAGSDPVLLDAAVIRRLAMDVRFKAARMHYRGAWLENVTVVTKARHGLLRLSPVTADLYGGSASLDSTVNALSKYPKTDMLLSLDKVDVATLSKDVLGKAEYGGLLRFKAALSCEGDRSRTMLRSLNGKVSFQLADGIFPGVDLMRMAKTTHERKDKGGTVEASDSDSTRFGSIDGTGIITSGVLNNRDLEVKAPGLRAKGEGALSLYTQKIDYLLKVKLVPTSEGQGGKASDDMFGVMVPIRVGGTLDDPHYWVSLTEYVKALGGAVIGVAGTVLGGVKNVVTSVGNAVTGSSGSDKSKDGEPTEKKRGIFNLFGLF